MRIAIASLAALIAAVTAANAAQPLDRYVVAHCMQCCNAATCAFGSSAAPKDMKDLSSALLKASRHADELVRFKDDPYALAAYEIQLAKRAGVDAFGMFHLGMLFHKPFEAKTRGYWQAALEDGVFKCYPEVWMPPTSNNVEKMVAEIVDLKKNYDSAWFRIDGKYVLAAFGVPALTEAQLEMVCAPLGGRGKVYYVLWLIPRAEDMPGPGKYYHRATKPESVELADAVVCGRQGDYGTCRRFREGCLNYNRVFGKEPWYLACPSCYHRRATDTGFLMESLGPCSYRRDWQEASADASSRVVYIMTWNDFAEDSGIVPDMLHGDAWLRLTRAFSRRFKSLPEEPPSNTLMLFHHPQVTEIPVALPPDAKPTQCHYQQRTPPADYIAIALDADEPCEVVVTTERYASGRAWYPEVGRRSFGKGLGFWLLCHRLGSITETALPNRDPVNVPVPETAPVYPEAEEGLFVDDMPAFGGHREIFVTVRRKGKPDVTFRSKTPVTDRAGAGDHSTMAACWQLD